MFAPFQLQVVDGTEGAAHGQRPARTLAADRLSHFFRQRIGKILIEDPMDARRHAARRCTVNV